MIKFLNNSLKGLMASLVIVTILGFASLDIKPTSPNTLILVSSSMINSLTTNDKSNVSEEETENKEVNNEVEEEIKLEIDSKNESVNNNEEIVDDKVNTEVNEEVINDETEEKIEEVVEEIVVQGVYAPNLEVASTYSAIETYYGKMTGYGPDCVGCSGITASGMNVLNGNIYYNDVTFGNIRIVAGDKSIPFGSIIRITGINISSDPVIAIVLDRGGMIGFAEWKHSYFDLLYESENAALSFGRQDATFELLRNGY